MEDLMLFMGAAMPEEFILDELAKSIAIHKSTGEGKSRIQLLCTLLLSKELTDRKGLGEAIEEMATARKGMDLLKTTKS